MSGYNTTGGKRAAGISRGKMAFIAGALIVLLCMGIFLAAIANKVHHLDTYQGVILKKMTEALEREVRYKKGEVTFFPGLQFSFSDIVIAEKNNKEEATDYFLRADRLSFRIGILRLLTGNIAFREVILTRPDVKIRRLADGSYNISDLIDQDATGPFHVKAVKVENGNLEWKDQFLVEREIPWRIKEIDMRISNLTRGKKTKFVLNAAVDSAEGLSRISLAGKAKIPARSAPLMETFVDARLQVKAIDAAQYWEYYRAYVPFNKVLGRIDGEVSFRGRLREFESEGQLHLAGLHFDYPGVFGTVLTPRNLRVAYEMNLDSSDIDIRKINIEMDNFHARGSCSITDIPSGDPRIAARAKTNPFKLEMYRQYIPYGIIQDDVAAFIQGFIRSGTYRLDEAHLDGRVSEIAHMEAGDNHKVLTIRGTILEGGRLDFGGNIPPFNGIRGKLSLAGEDFILQDMSGRFGTSPFTLNGKITGYCKEPPAGYPFAMTLTPREPELRWLLGAKAGPKLAFAGNSTLNLKGWGTTADYAMAGDWQLDGAAYRFENLIQKPAATANSLMFSGGLHPGGAAIRLLRYELSPLALVVTANYDHRHAGKITLKAETNPMLIQDTAKYFPFLATLEPEGMIQLSLQGEGQISDPEKIGWRGEISLRDMSFSAAKGHPQLAGINGSLSLNGDKLETSTVTGRIGNSAFSAKGEMAHLASPTVHVSFHMPRLDPVDLGWKPAEGGKEFADIRGRISWQEHHWSIPLLAGRYNHSLFELRGRLHTRLDDRLTHSEIRGSLRLSSPYLDMGDVMSLLEASRNGKEGESDTRTALSLIVTADKAEWKGLECENLVGEMNIVDQMYTLKGLALEILGGKIHAEGEINRGKPAQPFHVKFDMERISSDALHDWLGWEDRQLTGLMSARGSLSAKGTTPDDLKKTVVGEVAVTVERGMMKKFSSLAKIFSILNVSQLLKVQLPDMVVGGMPYNEIKGTFHFREGFVSTEDLFVRSDAMNIAAVGKVDLTKEEVDAIIGIQPLQTVDKIVSRIPIVGWIITGKEGTLINAYFETKGKLTDPTVKAIPFQSMATGVFDIFKRVFQLPVKIFTDTGEVLIGN